jgi:anthranilate synthase/aminodeoxychorismate synthase-like glutamine amidotransferase
MILLIDNYDSFTYNLVQRLGEIDRSLEMVVHRNDQITVEQVAKLKPDRIIISPGPCTPKEAGISNAILERFATTTPILGVCLGHQCIGHVFGGNVIRNWRIMHGKTSPILHDGRTVFAGLSNPFQATRYHSLVIERATIPNCLEISAWTAEREIMGVRHRELLVEGIQFHPESILTVEGKALLQNFLDLARRGGC